VAIRTLPQPRNPVLLQHAEQRRKSADNRIADAITAFAGSMPFVYAHVIWFSILIGHPARSAANTAKSAIRPSYAGSPSIQR
jgi:hypothetical protein